MQKNQNKESGIGRQNFSEAELAIYNAIAVYRALLTAPGEPGENHRLSLTEELFDALGKASHLISRATPNISRSLDDLAGEYLQEHLTTNSTQQGN